MTTTSSDYEFPAPQSTSSIPIHSNPNVGTTAVRNQTASSAGNPPSSGGMVSITTRSGGSSREVHVTLPQARRRSTNGDEEEDLEDEGDDALPSPTTALPAAAVPGVSVSVLGGPGHIQTGSISHPLASPGGPEGVGHALIPGTPTQDIDNLYYEDPAKGYRRATTGHTVDSLNPSDGAPRKRRVRRRTANTAKTASSVGAESAMYADTEGSGGGEFAYGLDDDDVMEYEDEYDYDEGGVYSDGASAAWAHHPAGGKAKDGLGEIRVGDDKLGVDDRNRRSLDAGSPKHGHGHGRASSSINGGHRRSSQLPGTANSNGGLGSGGQLYHHHHHGEDDLEDSSIPFSDEDEDSPYPEVRASVSNIDDPEMPVLTLRMWILGISLCVLGSSANTFFNFRYPAPSIAPLVLLLIAHPCGKFLAYTMPIESWTVRIPVGVVRVLRWFWIGTYVGMMGRWWTRRRGGKDVVIDEAECEEVLPWEWEIQLNPGPFNIKVCGCWLNWCFAVG